MFEIGPLFLEKILKVINVFSPLSPFGQEVVLYSNKYDIPWCSVTSLLNWSSYTGGEDFQNSSVYFNVIKLIFSFFEISMATQLNRFKVPFSFNVLCQVCWNWYSGSGSEKKTFKNCQYAFTISLLSFFKMDMPLHLNQFHRIFPKGCFRPNLVKINQWLCWKFPLSISFYNVYIVFLWK